MSDSNTEILIRALEASGSEREAKLARAILGAAPAQPTAPEAPPAAVDPAPPAVPAEAGTPPPPGKAPLTSMADVDALSQAEIVERMDEVDVLLRGEK
jgi:hypothetical protein